MDRVRRRACVSLEEVGAWALALPGATEDERQGRRSWLAGKRHFAWERPFSKADLKRFGTDEVPHGPIVAVMVEDLAHKDAVLSSGLRGFFTIPHFEGYPAVLIDLSIAGKRAVRAALEDAWSAVQPP